MNWAWELLKLGPPNLLFGLLKKLLGFLLKFISFYEKGIVYLIITNIKQFFKYFKKVQHVGIVGWYEGYLEKSTSANNCLNSINSTLNKEATCQCCKRMINRDP